jgi:hypothetical protein
LIDRINKNIRILRTSPEYKSVALRNAFYDVSLNSKIVDGKEAAWSIGSIAEHKTEADQKNDNASFNQAANVDLYPRSLVVGMLPDELLAIPSIKFDRIVELPDGLCQVEGEHSSLPDENNQVDVNRYKFKMDPRNHYCVLEGELKSNQFKLFTKRDIESNNGKLFCRSLAYVLSNPGGDVLTEIKHEFTNHQMKSRAVEDDFYLTSYGLPEPPSAPARPWRYGRSVLIGGIAIVLAAVALTVRRFSRSGNTSNLK